MPTVCQPRDIVFIFDTSISVDNTEFDQLLQFAEDAIDSVDVGVFSVMFGSVSFSHLALTATPLDRYSTKAAAKSGLWSDVPHINASTRADLALSQAANDVFGQPGDRPGYDNVAIFMNDGKSHTPVTTAAAILRTVAEVIAVSLDSADENQIEDVVGGRLDLIIRSPTFGDLKNHVTEMMTAACGECVPLCVFFACYIYNS